MFYLYHMKKNGEIIIIEDDEDDRLLLKDIFESLNYSNKIVFIEDPTKVLEYLSDPNVSPFIIISDINMPKIDGFELRNQIRADAKINIKCVPYIFLSTSKLQRMYLRRMNVMYRGILRKKMIFLPSN